MTIDFWDSGQGDCSVISRGAAELTIIDVGPRNSPLISWLREQRNFTISDIVLTHNDADHIGALPALLEACGNKIKKVWLLQDGNRSGPRQRTVINLLSPLQQAEKAYGLTIRTIRSGQSLWTDAETGTRLDILYPSALSAVLNHSTPNLGSAILTLRHPNAEQAILWPGDNTVERAAEVFPNSYPWLLHGPHHGSPEDCKRPDRRRFHSPIDTLKPERAFISVGSPNRYSHPNPRYLGRLQKLGCQIACSGLTRWCDRRIKQREEGRHILNGAALLGLRRIGSGFACRGALRIHVDHEGFYEDEHAEKHREAVRSLSHPYCQPRESWRR